MCSIPPYPKTRYAALTTHEQPALQCPGEQIAELRLTMPWIERRMATLAASLWKCRAMRSLPCASSTLNSGASLMHAIFSISAEPLLRLRWSRVLKNALHVRQVHF